MTEVEFWCEKTCLLHGFVEERDDSISDEKRTAQVVHNMHVIVFISGIDYDITEFMKEKHEKTFALFEELFLEYYRQKFTNDVA